MTHRSRARGLAAALALLLWLALVGFVLWHDIRGYAVPRAQRALVDRSVDRFAREARVEAPAIRRIYSRTFFRREGQSCVMFTTYRDRRGGALYCYRDTDGRLVEERLSGVPFGNRSLVERLLDAIERH